MWIRGCGGSRWNSGAEEAAGVPKLRGEQYLPSLCNFRDCWEVGGPDGWRRKGAAEVRWHVKGYDWAEGALGRLHWMSDDGD